MAYALRFGTRTFLMNTKHRKQAVATAQLYRVPFGAITTYHADHLAAVESMACFRLMRLRLDLGILRSYNRSPYCTAGMSASQLPLESSSIPRNFLLRLRLVTMYSACYSDILLLWVEATIAQTARISLGLSPVRAD